MFKMKAVLTAVAVLLLAGCYKSTTPLYEARHADVDVIHDGDRFAHWRGAEARASAVGAEPETRQCAQILQGHRVCRQETNGLPDVLVASVTGKNIALPSITRAGEPVTLHRIADHSGVPTYVVMGALANVYYYGIVLLQEDFLVYYEPQSIRPSMEFTSAALLERAIHVHLDRNPAPSGVLMRVR